MTRPRVEPDKRQRTAQACDSCKRRKQKCDGHLPCATCTKRQFDCSYSNGEQDPHYASPATSQSSSTKRQATDYNTDHGNVVANFTRNPRRTGSKGSQELPGIKAEEKMSVVENASEFKRKPPSTPDDDVGDIKLPTAETADDTEIDDDEADNHTMTRMMEDGSGTGRLLYVGDSSTLSFLQLLRMIVETAAGPSTFSLDPSRHQISETRLTLSPHNNFTHMVPDKETALILANSYFANLYGLVEALDERTFLAKLDRCYDDPFSLDHTWLCHLNLVFAIGLCLATPDEGSREAQIVDNIRSKYPDQSEVFYYNAKSLSNPLIGFEDAGFWSIQALMLMTVYMLTRSKESTAYAYCGMAIRSAYSLGLHREETLVIFSPQEQKERRKVWRSLFVLDRLLAVSLGRPVAIAEEESSSDILRNHDFSVTNERRPQRPDVCAAGLEAAVRSCHVMGNVLRLVYTRRRISIKLAQILTDECKKWSQNLPANLHWRQASSKDKRQATAILHANIIYCQAVVLLTRPFFLYLLSIQVQRSRMNNNIPFPRRKAKMEKFSDACVIAATHNIALCQNAYEGGYLPRLNAFPTYSIFSSGLVLFANQFARPATDGLQVQCMQNAITILGYCGVNDPQAKRCANILQEFGEVIRTQSSPNPFQNHPPGRAQALAPTAPFEEQNIVPLPPLPGASTMPPMDNIPSFSSISPEPLDNSFASQGLPVQLGHYPFSGAFSGLLDMENTALPSNNEASSADEDFQFDTMWQWPFPSTPLPTTGVNTPGMGMTGRY